MPRPRNLRSWLRFLPLEDRLNPVAMLPDLSPDVANLTNWVIQSDGNGGLELAYATGMQNIGKGAFELRGTGTVVDNPSGGQSEVVLQRIYNDDKTYTDVIAGYFTYHPGHGHVHYDDFAHGRIRLRNGTQVGDIVATGPKTSFFLLDAVRNNPQLPGSPASPVYGNPGPVQGISVGWKDVYGSGLDGQQINITGIPPGDYWLEVEADPMNHVIELDETNNVTRIAITISDKQVPNLGLRVMSSSPLGAQVGPVSGIDLTFNMAIDPSTFTPDDVVMNGPSGPITITKITQLSSITYRAEFASQTKAGTYTATIGPNITGSDGKLMNQDGDSNYGEAADDSYFNIFAITAPRVTGTSPTGNTSTPVSSVRIQYNKPMDVSTFTLSDIVSFTGPSGNDLMGQIAGIVPVTTPESTLFDINFNSPMAGFGTYTIVLEPNMSDMLGNTVDQNGDAVTDAKDRYTTKFTIVPVGTYGPDAFGYSAVSAKYEDLTGITSGWTTVINSSDDASVAFNLGTNKFNFHGVTYTGNNQLYISSNGIITFGSANSAFANSDLSVIGTSGTQATIATYWDDLYIGTSSPQVRAMMQDVNSDGTPDRLIVDYNNNYHHDAKTGFSTIRFQTILQLNTGSTPGDIYFNYADLDHGTVTYNNGASATIGIRSAGTSYTKLLISQNSGTHPLVGSNKSIKVSVPKVASIVRMNPNPAEVGDLEYMVTFTDPVTGVDPSDFTLTTTGKIVGAKVDHIHATSDARVYEVHVKSGVGGGTLRLDLADNDSIVSLIGAKLGGTGLGNGSFTAGQVYTVIQPPPRVLGINVGDGTAQRSMVKETRVVFNTGVIFAGNPADSFQVVGPNGPVSVAVDLSNSSPDQTVALLTFSGPNTQFGSLKDGNYNLTVIAANITTGGVQLDGDLDGNPGGNYTNSFHRLFGDVNGDGTVDGSDYSEFGNSFGSTGVANPFDFNNSGMIDGDDFAEFGNRFGITI